MSQDTLARRLFLILHDPFTGKPGVGIEPIKYGLVATALADLMMERRIGIENGHILLADPREDGSRDDGTDSVSALLLEGIQSGSPITRSWVDSFTDLVYELVARELTADGVVRRVHGGRRMVRRNPDRFRAVDLLRAAGPRIRLEHMLRSPHDLDLAGAVLAGVIDALHMERVLDVDRDRAAVKRSLASATERLPADLRGLVNDVAAAVATIALDFRRL